MLEIAGLILSGIGLIKDLYGLYNDLDTWTNEDLEVDKEWLPLALELGILDGAENDYRFVSRRKVPTLELKGTHQVVAAHNKYRKIIYQIVRGSPQDHTVVVLMKLASANP